MGPAAYRRRPAPDGPGHARPDPPDPQASDIPAR